MVELDNLEPNEIEVKSDGGGNQYACHVNYFRYSHKSKKFESIGFVSDGEVRNDASCLSDGKLIENAIFEEFLWVHMYPESYRKFTESDLSVSEFDDVNAFLCEKKKVSYKYDGEDFVEFESKIIETKVNGLEYLNTCIH